MAEKEMPTVNCNFVPAKAGDIIKLGPITCRVLEDGSRTGKAEIQRQLSHRMLNLYQTIE